MNPPRPTDSRPPDSSPSDGRPPAGGLPGQTDLDWLTGSFAPALFYFCLKRTGNQTEAQDLAQHILEQVLRSLDQGRRRGTWPADVAAWAWQIAWNQHGRWVAGRIRDRQRLADSRPGPEEAAGTAGSQDGPATDPAELLVRQETLELLGRELAFTAREYRELVTGFYLNNLSVPQLARKLGLPEGTIKTRLAKSRRQLKEGMTMARTFGPRSYNPQDVSFTTSGNQPDNVPWKFLGRRLSNNLLLEAHNNPSSLADLALALGVALPYVEDEVAQLAEASLMVQQADGRWLTNFFVADRELQLDIHRLLSRDAASRTARLTALLDGCRPAIEDLAFNRPDWRELGWYLLLACTDWLNDQASRQDGWDGSYTPRPGGGAWDIIGLESCPELAGPDFVGQCGTNGSGDYRKCWFGAYRIAGWGLWDRPASLSSPELDLLADILLHRRPAGSLSGQERNLLQGLSPRLVDLAGGTVRPRMLVLGPGGLADLRRLVRSQPAWPDLAATWTGLQAGVRQCLARRQNPCLARLPGYYTQEFMSRLRMSGLQAAVAAGWLDPPDQPETSTLGMVLALD